MDKKKLTALVLLDLSKAFDSINHHRLLQKLANIGASPTTVKWFKSYLSGRSQSIRINSTLSDPISITHGVPQGAILSPLLFCIYLNDLPSVSQNSSLESYVDDSKVLLSFPLCEIDTAIKNLEQDLHRVAIWCCENYLLINLEKTKNLIIWTRQLMSTVLITTCKYIGQFFGQIPQASGFCKRFGCHIGQPPNIWQPHLTTCFFLYEQIMPDQSC